MLKCNVELLVSEVLLECKDLLVQVVYKVSLDHRGNNVFQVLLEIKVIVVNEVNVVSEEKRHSR